MDLIRTGTAPEVILRKGAKGLLPLAAEESIEALTLLATGPEAFLRETALKTLQGWDRAELRQVLASPRTPPDVLCFAVVQLAGEDEDLRQALLKNPGLPPEFHTVLEPESAPAPAVAAPGDSPAGPGSSGPSLFHPPPGLADENQSEPQAGVIPESQPAPASPPDQPEIELLAKLAAGVNPGTIADEVPPEVTKHDDELTPAERETLIQKVSRMTAVEKIKAAITGNLETRNLLIRDPNKIVSRAVLQSPKISETEAEGYASAKNVSEEVLRLLAANRKYRKCYVVMRALVNNPRAPLDVTLRLLVRLTERDLKGVAINRNVPDALRGMATKLVKQKEDATKPKIAGRH